MRLASIRTPDGPRLGVGVRVDGTELVVRADATGVPVPATPLEFLALPEPERARVLTAATALAADGPSGDTVFALATGQSGLPGNMMALSVLAARVTAAAVVRAVLNAKGVGGPGLPAIPAAAELA